MRVYYLQHAEGEDLGNMRAWFEEQGWPINGVRLDRGDLMPPIDWFDVLVVLGGPMSAVPPYEDRIWLETEIELIRAAIVQEKVVIGLCLGAQLIAAALGARVYQASAPEIGWFPIEPVGNVPWLPAGEYLSWHEDTFELPDGAICIARSEHTAHQGFTYGDRVVALQFHLEATVNSPQAFQAAGSSLPAPSKTVQAPVDLSGKAEYYQRSEQVMRALLEHLKPFIKPTAKLADV